MIVSYGTVVVPATRVASLCPARFCLLIMKKKISGTYSLGGGGGGGWLVGGV